MLIVVCKGQQLVGQVDGMMCSCFDFGQGFVGYCFFELVEVQQVGDVGEDDVEQVVEVVGNFIGQLVQCLEFLCLDLLVFELVVVGEQQYGMGADCDFVVEVECCFGDVFVVDECVVVVVEVLNFLVFVCLYDCGVFV